MDGISELFNAMQQWFLIMQENQSIQNHKLDLLIALAQKNAVLNVTQVAGDNRSGGIDIKGQAKVDVTHDVVAGDESIAGDSHSGGK